MNKNGISPGTGKGEQWTYNDNVKVPSELPAGRYVLGWRWDSEQSAQVWSNCAVIQLVDAHQSEVKTPTSLSADGQLSSGSHGQQSTTTVASLSLAGAGAGAVMVGFVLFVASRRQQQHHPRASPLQPSTSGSAL